MRTEFTIPSITRPILVLLVLFACVNAAFADGGRLRFHKPAGPFVVTLFTAPDPLTKGHADFSVAVERAGVQGLVQDAVVDLILTPANGQGSTIVLHASHGAATSKWLQAANFLIPARGLWRVTVMVRRGFEEGQCSGEVQVRAAETSDLMWDVLPVPLIALFFVLHDTVKRRHNRDRHNRDRDNRPLSSAS